jgi:hypothetical protein
LSSLVSLQLSIIFSTHIEKFQDAIRPELIKEKTLGWLLSTLEYKKKSPPGLADLLSRIVKHGETIGF